MNTDTPLQIACYPQAKTAKNLYITTEFRVITSINSL